MAFYSMDGDIALLDEIMAITKEEHAWLMVDESHATGVVGGQGKGTHSHFGLSERQQYLQVPRKALGGSGGYVAGSQNWSASGNYQPAILFFPLPYLNTALRSCQRRFVYLKTGDGAPDRLWSNINYFKRGMDEIGFEPLLQRLSSDHTG